VCRAPRGPAHAHSPETRTDGSVSTEELATGGPDRAGADASTALEVVDLSKDFPGVRALDHVSFAVRPGTVHALIGENGAGKSTLVKVMTGVYQPDAGQVRLAGRPVTFRNPLEAQHAGVSTIYQEVNLVPLLSVARNLFLNREPRRLGLVDVRRMNHEATRILREYGIEVDVTRPLRSLGLGAQQMVAIARAVQIDARVVIMDEPTSSLEQREVETLFGVVRRLREQGIAIVYISHRLDELYALCDEVTVMRDGRVVHVGPMGDLDRLRLIALMLGRDVAEVSRHGSTAFEHAEAQDGEPILRARNLSRRHQLDDVSLEIHKGEVVGLGGLLGSGRSETAKAIAGALPLDGGEVELAGRPLRGRGTARAIRAGVVMLPEDRKAEGILPDLSVRENIVLAARPRLSRMGLVSRSREEEVVRFFMERLRIKAASPNQPVSQLSGGNQQKVMLARWLCLHPKVLLLDEPTRGIDVGAKAEVQGLINELARDGLGVLLISSELEELIEGSDRILALKDGAVVGRLSGSQVSEADLMKTLAGHPRVAEKQER
jgi:galactofuranose transport system ATP-binding protein